MFFNMFVCGPLQSFAVNVCTFLRRFFSYFHEFLHIKIFSVKKNNQYSTLQLRHAARRLNENSTDFVFQSFRKKIKANSLISTAHLTSIHPTVQIFNPPILTQIFRFWIPPINLSDRKCTPPGWPQRFYLFIFLLRCNCFNHVRQASWQSCQRAEFAWRGIGRGGGEVGFSGGGRGLSLFLTR